MKVKKLRQYIYDIKTIRVYSNVLEKLNNFNIKGIKTNSDKIEYLIDNFPKGNSDISYLG